MRYLPLLLLASCQNWGLTDTADALMPDEFTLGQGTSTLGGTLDNWGSKHGADLDADIDSTYAALTWDIPSIGRDESGMDRTTQRNLALALDRLVGDELEEEEKAKAVVSGPLKMNLREGVELPPKEVLYAVLAVLVLIALLLRHKAKAKRSWR